MFLVETEQSRTPPETMLCFVWLILGQVRTVIYVPDFRPLDETFEYLLKSGVKLL